MNTRKQALYVGAGTDFLPYLNYPEYDFVACDSLPCNELGQQCLKDCEHLYTQRCTCCSRFQDRLIGIMNLVGFHVYLRCANMDPDTNSGYVVFKKNDQTVTYYYNTPYSPDMKLWDQYQNHFSVLILSGFFPEKSVARLLKEDCVVVGARSSFYEDYTTNKKCCNHNKNTIVTHMYRRAKRGRYNLRKRLMRKGDYNTDRYSCLLMDFETGRRSLLNNIQEIEYAKEQI